MDCPECGSQMVLRNSKHGPFFGCSSFPRCRGTHGAHPDGRPLGTPADAETKAYRIRAHAAFDKVWESGDMKRNEAYRWLARQMQMSSIDCHIGKMDKGQCMQVEYHCKRYSLTGSRKGYEDEVVDYYSE